MDYTVIIDNAQVLIAPGKKKLSPGLPAGYKLTSLGTDRGGVYFNPGDRYPYNKVWTSLDNLQTDNGGEDPPPVGDDKIRVGVGKLQLEGQRSDGSIVHFQNDTEFDIPEVAG